MKKEIAEKWVAALRGGEFKQARGTLQDPETGGYCCLGVLCAIAPEGEQEYCDDEPGRLFGDTLDEQKPIMRWAGIRVGNDTGEFHGHVGEWPDLTSLNDGRPAGKHDDFPKIGAVKPHSFDEIADIIERDWELL